MPTYCDGDWARLRYGVLAAHDGTKLAYHVLGAGTPVVCLPGGPMQDSVSLGDLGGLSGVPAADRHPRAVVVRSIADGAVRR